MQEATVCYPIRDREVLLIRKQRGIGAGNLVGPGGKIESGESASDCVERELREELRVTPIEPARVGELTFHFGDGETDERSMHVYVYTAEGVDGTPQETAEAIPVWASVTDPPYEEMWPDDRIWFPHMLDGRPFVGEFVLSDDHRLRSYEVDLDVSVE